jgi:TPR repeat protein
LVHLLFSVFLHRIAAKQRKPR